MSDESLPVGTLGISCFSCNGHMCNMAYTCKSLQMGMGRVNKNNITKMLGIHFLIVHGEKRTSPLNP